MVEGRRQRPEPAGQPAPTPRLLIFYALGARWSLAHDQTLSATPPTGVQHYCTQNASGCVSSAIEGCDLRAPVYSYHIKSSFNAWHVSCTELSRLTLGSCHTDRAWWRDGV